MCGIAGRYNFVTGAPVSAALVGGMTDLLAHRGPDGDGVWVDGAVGFGHRRLAIIDLSPAGRQPMSSPDRRFTVTFNGEIYNFRELRRELEALGHAFQTRTDTEAILAAYRQWGPDCLSRLHGMFAFAIWDATERVLFIARDRVGKKPLHYWLDRDGLAFASEPKAFLADPSFVPEVEPTAISAYLSYQYVPSPLSAFRGVHKLPPAHYLIVRDGRIEVERYWKLSYGRKHGIDEQTAREELLRHLTEAVRKRLISDVPLGAFLSGGVDSSLVVALMAQVSGGAVKTFSIGFDEDDFNELPYARLVAERYATDHHEFIVRPSASEIFDQLVWHYNEPYADASAIPTFYLSRLARQHVTVALNGDAGDENFAGYRRYITPRRAQRFDRLPSGLQRGIRAAAHAAPAPRRSNSLLYRGRRWLRRLSDTPAGRYSRRVMIFDDDLKSELCTPGFRAAAGASGSEMLARALERSDARDFVDALLDFDVTYYLSDCLLVKVDIATMAYGLEGRSPMLDHEFMAFAAGLPSDLKLRGTDTKYILKQAARTLIPESIIDRPKKGFSVPLGRWFRGELRELAGDTLLGPRMAQRGYFEPGLVERLLREHWSGQSDWEDQLWSLLMLESWHRMFIDKRPSVDPTGAHLYRKAPSAVTVVRTDASGPLHA